MYKKSQAALEFLTTYAWAFLVILIMIGALAYFGVLNPSALLPERCNLGAELECRDFKLDAGKGDTDGEIVLKMVNNVGESIVINKIETSSEGSQKLECTYKTEGCVEQPADTNCPTGATVLPKTVAQGKQEDFKLKGCNNDEWIAAGFTPNQKGKVEVTITYYTARSGPDFPHQVMGDIFATVQ